MGDIRDESAVRRNMMRSALVAGVVAGFGCFFPFLPWIMLLMLASGGIAITIFHWRMPGKPTPPSMGFRIGLLSGFFAWLTNVTVNLLLLIPAGNRARLQTQLQEKLTEALSTAPDQSSREMLTRVGDLISSPSGLLSIFAIGMAILGVVFLVLGGIGGAIGATLFGSRPHHD